MGLGESLGVGSFFQGFSFSSIATWISIAVVAIGFFILVGMIVFGFYLRKAKKVTYKYSIPIFQTINGKYSRIGIDKAREIFVPDTNISLFHLKSRRLYIARPTRWMGKDECWYTIAPNGEWVNFDLNANLEKSTLADIDYDHRDTRYAYVNLKEIIKRNYKDKNTKWWKEYAPMISFVVITFVFVAGLWILISQMGNLVAEFGPLFERQELISKNLLKAVELAQNLNSGVASAG